MRLHKILANAGVGSRRTIETWIREGKVQVNGSPAQVGQFLKPGECVQINGKVVDYQIPSEEEVPRVILYHKPEGEICSHSTEEGKKRVFDNLPPLEKGRWVMVGRLDVNTSGLLLFTNQGELANRLMHPRFEMERQYAVRVIGSVTEKTLSNLKKGVELTEGVCRFKEIVARNNKQGGANQWFTVTLGQGKYREVRHLWESQGCTVSRLIRIKYGNISLPRDLKKGDWRALPSPRVEELLSQFNLKTLE